MNGSVIYLLCQITLLQKSNIQLFMFDMLSFNALVIRDLTFNYRAIVIIIV